MELTDKIRVTNEDNMIMMSRFDDKHFDLALVDPPYGIGINHNMGRRKGDKNSSHKKVKWDDKIPDKEYFEELFRVSKNQIIWGGNYMTDFLKPSSCWLLWDKGFSEDLSFAQFEMAWTSFDGSCKKYDLNPNQKNKIHPTQKPVNLYKWILDRFAKENDKIIDTHIGSGSIAIACHDYKFELDACEIDNDYFQKTIQRIKNHTSQLKLF